MASIKELKCLNINNFQILFYEVTNYPSHYKYYIKNFLFCQNFIYEVNEIEDLFKVVQDFFDREDVYENIYLYIHNHHHT